jgi:polyisoprenoid-binding protein YceI
MVKTSCLVAMSTTLCLFTAIPLVGQAQEQFRIDAEATNITVRVGRAGIFAFAGHDHEIAAPVVNGRITVDRSDVRQSSILLEFDAAALKVTGRGEPPADVPEVQRVMLSEQVLDVQRHPKIIFRSRSVSLVEQAGEEMMLRVDGDLTLHGTAHSVAVPVRVRLTADRLIAEGNVTVRQTDFGIRPVTVGVGTVRVRDQVEVVFTVSARPV